MKHLLAWLTALMLISPSAHAFVIDFNEKWLIDDAYNRAMENAKENMRPSKGRRSGGDPNFKTDVLYTGPQTMAGDELLNDRTVWRLAGHFPQPQRKQAAAMFTQIISSFNGSVEKLYGVPKENVATGMVALLAGGYAAYYNKPFPERFVKPTVEQVGDFLRKKPELFDGKTESKVASYQTGVGVGMLLQMLQQEAAQKGSADDVAKLKQAGASVFRAVLGVAPEDVDFTAAGLKFR
ncbi:MAG: hypothetical protein KA914_07170 [Ottowia sp.]|jgi:hypothetical protein|nr:hypothetical protein [Ottowia sp.]